MPKLPEIAFYLAVATFALAGLAAGTIQAADVIARTLGWGA